MAQTVLIVGSTGNIGISATLAALNAGYNVLAIVRNQTSAEKLYKNVGNKDGITVVEADITSPSGLQGVVDKVKTGELPAFQHVYASAGGVMFQKPLHELSDEEYRRAMTANLDANYYAYRATVPYLLEQKNPNSTWTVCTGAAGDFGILGGAGLGQGALFSLAAVAIRELAGTNIRVNEAYLGLTVIADTNHPMPGAFKVSQYANIYKTILQDTSIRNSRVIVLKPEDLETVNVEKKERALLKLF